ncbi:MAG: cbb3-type cytochrome c oxidase subunit I [bacterium]|nr:cbb3-type cytochrome c oxidase subunit I [bacterium]
MGAAGVHQGGEEDRDLARLLAGYIGCATFWLLLSTAVGVIISFKFAYPDLMTSPYLSFGRLRPIHTNDTFYAWASMALVGMAFYVGVKTCGTRLYSIKLGWASLALFNLAALLGTIALDLGFNNGDQEYREWLWWIEAIFMAALVLAAYNLIVTAARRADDDLYLSNWYTIGGMVFTIILASVAIVPWYQRGLGQVGVQAFFMHNAVGMWFTPLTLGLWYYVLPKLLNRPIYSYALGVLAFWTNLVFYPIIGAHHFIFSPLPWWLQTLAIVFSVAMLVPVWAGSANFLLTMRGRWEQVRRSYALPFVFVGVLGYLLGSTQGTFEAFRSLQQVWHLTNFTVGHSHLTMYGFVTFGIWGGIYALLPRATGRAPSLILTGLHFWLATVGVVIYVMALSVGGTIQGLVWISGQPFINSVTAIAPDWLWRAIGGSLMFLSHVVFAWNVWSMITGRAQESRAAQAAEAAS